MFRRAQLEYFVTVADEGQITSAARKLHIAQPALSQAIAQLEHELGLTLFVRHARGVSLSLAGERFYEKAGQAVLATDVAMQTARSLARGEQRTLEFGFLGLAPGLDSPGPIEAFCELYPEVEICFRELPFPTTPTSTWLSQVDVAVCHRPPEEPQVWSHLLRHEPRVVLAPLTHPLARRSDLAVEELFDELFIGFHPSIEPEWAGFWSLDDHRGAPSQRLTGDNVANPQEVVAALTIRQALTAVPASVGTSIAGMVPELLAAIPLRGADPVAITLVGHQDRRNPIVNDLVAFAISSSGAASPTDSNHRVLTPPMNR
jgi:DNA-binding transcriptional LysR family regulator